MGPLSRILSALLLCAALLTTGCSKDAMVKETTDEVNQLTIDIVEKVNSAEDKKAGVAEAKKLIDERKGELRPKLDEISGLRGFQVSDENITAFTDAMLDATVKISGLQIELMIESAQDPELEAALEELSSSYEALLEL